MCSPSPNPNQGCYPSVAYAARAPSDPAGTLRPEVVLAPGAGSQTDSDSFGDYSQMAVDPQDGGIVRLAQVRRWQVGDYPREYDTVVKFGPVGISGARYLLPARRVAMFLTPILKQRNWNEQVENVYRKFHLDKSPQQEYLNDVRFAGYRAYEPAGGVPGTSLAAKGAP